MSSQEDIMKSISYKIRKSINEQMAYRYENNIFRYNDKKLSVFEESLENGIFNQTLILVQRVNSANDASDFVESYLEGVGAFDNKTVIYRKY